MALQWNFNERIGTALTKQGQSLSLYNGNALLIALYETEKTYQMIWFAADEAHLKNMLGLSRDYDSCLDDNNMLFDLTELILTKKCYKRDKIAQLFAKSKCEIKINLTNSPF